MGKSPTNKSPKTKGKTQTMGVRDPEGKTPQGKCWYMKSYGNPCDKTLLIWKQRDLPEPKRGEMLVKIKAAALNPVDFKIATGHVLYAGAPWVPGIDFSGQIVDCNCCPNFVEGDEVYGMAPHFRLTNLLNMNQNLGGSLSQYMLVRHDTVALKPTSISHAEAACFPLVGQTVQACEKISGIKAGHKVEEKMSISSY